MFWISRLYRDVTADVLLILCLFEVHETPFSLLQDNIEFFPGFSRVGVSRIHVERLKEALFLYHGPVLWLSWASCLRTFCFPENVPI